MNKLQLALVATLVGMTQGCATLSQSECEEADWQIIGLEDGSAGRPVSYIGRHRKACADYGVKPNMAQYQRGHADGVRAFCTPRKGYQLATAGRGHNDVCPADLRVAFLAAYDDGLTVRAAQQDMLDAQNRVKAAHAEMQGIASRIDGLENSLVSGDGTPEDRQSWLTQIKNLRVEEQYLQAELHRLENQASDRQREYEYLSSRFSY